MEDKKFDDAMVYYENVRKTLSGLYEILRINLNENDFYFQAGLDNLKALHENSLEMLKSCFPAREVRMKLRDIEFDEKEMMEIFPL